MYMEKERNREIGRGIWRDREREGRCKGRGRRGGEG